MKLILDTRIMLWWLLGDSRLRQETRDLMGNSVCVVSVASVWEVAIKHRLGKLAVDPASFRDESLVAGATLLAINDAHVIETARLPDIHAKPFRPADHRAGAYRGAGGDLVGRAMERVRHSAAAALAPFRVPGQDVSELARTGGRRGWMLTSSPLSTSSHVAMPRCCGSPRSLLWCQW